MAELVARRLAELGRDPRLVTPGAVAALRQHGGSGGAVHSVLAGALFLASTEDAPHVEAAHVARAASMRNDAPAPPEAPVSEPAAMSDPGTEQAVPAPGRAARFDAVNLAFGAVLAAEIAFVALRPMFGDRPEPAPPAAVVQPEVRAVAAAVRPPAWEPPLPALRPPAEEPPATVAQPVAPPRPRATAAALPTAVVAHVIVTYSRNDPTGPARAAAVSDALGSQGFAAAGPPMRGRGARRR